MRSRRFVLVAFWASLSAALGVSALPFLLINNPQPKCIEVTATEGINVVVRYEAPRDAANKGRGGSGLDQQWNKQAQEAKKGSSVAK